MRQGLKQGITITLSLLLLVIAVIVIDLGSYQQKNLSVIAEPIFFHITPGMSATRLTKILQKQGVIENPTRFLRLIRFRGLQSKLQAGEYYLSTGMTIKQMLENISKGKVYRRKFALIEGWTVKKVVKALNKAPAMQHDLPNETLAQVSDFLGVKKGSLEGLLLPDTYYYTYNMPDVDILQQAVTAMREALSEEWALRKGSLPYKNSYEALIAASLMEKETADDEEKASIASVLVSRLEQGMRLQFDPTVIYGLGDRYTGKLSHSDLRIDTPYNTYMHDGLPPTPITNPGRASIHAALNPDTTNYLYFVSKGDGTHAFSENLEQHQQAINKYLKKGKKK